MATSYQIVQHRDYPQSELGFIEDTWAVLYAIRAQAIQDFQPTRMFEHYDESARYFVRELDNNFISTGKEWPL